MDNTWTSYVGTIDAWVLPFMNIDGLVDITYVTSDTNIFNENIETFAFALPRSTSGAKPSGSTSR